MISTRLSATIQQPEEGFSVVQNDAVDSFGDIAVEAYMLVDLRAAADKIENVCGDSLADPPPGIYQLGHLEPTIVPGKPVFRKEDGVLKPLTDFAEANGAVYDDAGRVLISARIVKEKDKFLSNTPLLPYRGLYIARELVEHEINQFVAYHRRSGKTLTDVINKHFKPQAKLEEQQLNEVESCCRQVKTDLSDFLGERRWHMFFTHISGTSVRVERCMDWRAWEWEQKHGAAFRAGRYA